MLGPTEPAGQGKQHLVSQQSDLCKVVLISLEFSLGQKFAPLFLNFDFKVMCRIDDKQESFFGFSH